MKKITSLSLVIGIAILFIGCNPFLSKDLRKKNRCNRKLERAILKCPDLLKNDTIIKVVEIEVPAVEIDSFIVYEPDTTWLIEIQNDTIREFVRQKVFESFPFKDTIRHKIDGFTFLFYNDGGNIGYSVKKPSEVLKTNTEVIVPIVSPIKLTMWERMQNHWGKILFWVVILLIAYQIIRKTKNLFN